VAEKVYLTIDDVLYLHDEQLRLYGGVQGVRDQGLIISAVLRPQSGFYSDLIEEAAALWESLVMNHGFVDGNKRVGFASLVAFLGLNGLQITASPDEVIALIYGNLEAGTFRKENLDGWLRKNTGPL
jgi:death on curing protein